MCKPQKPLVSIGIPAYNRPEGLAKTIECFISQTYANLEIIVSNDASPNEQVHQVGLKMAGKDPRIRYILQEKNIGLLNNWEFVLKKATGKYFAWACDDDRWDCRFIEALLHCLEKSGDKASFCDFEVASENRHPIPGYPKSFYPLFKGFTSDTPFARIAAYLEQFALKTRSMQLQFSLFVREFVYGQYMQTKKLIPYGCYSWDRLFVLHTLINTRWSLTNEKLHTYTDDNQKAWSWRVDLGEYFYLLQNLLGSTIAPNDYKKAIQILDTSIGNPYGEYFFMYTHTLVRFFTSPLADGSICTNKLDELFNKRKHTAIYIYIADKLRTIGHRYRQRDPHTKGVEYLKTLMFQAQAYSPTPHLCTLLLPKGVDSIPKGSAIAFYGTGSVKDRCEDIVNFLRPDIIIALYLDTFFEDHTSPIPTLKAENFRGEVSHIIIASSFAAEILSHIESFPQYSETDIYIANESKALIKTALFP